MDSKGIQVSRTQLGVLFILWLAFLLSFVDRLAWPPIMPLAAKELGMTAKQAGSYMTAFYAGYVFTQLPGGFLTDRFGYRRVLLGSFVIMGSFTFLMGTVTTYEQGFLYRVLAGLGSGAIFSACVRGIFDWFPEKGRGTAMGFFMTASSLGVSVVNLIVPTISQQYGWNAAFFMAGFFPFIGVCAAFFLLKEQTNYRESLKSQSFRQFARDIAVLLQNRNLMITGASGFCAMWATWGTATWANTYINKGLHLSLVEAGFVMSLFGVAALCCKPVAGILTDWAGQKKWLLFGMLAFFGPMLLWFGSNQSTQLLYILAPALGIAAFVYSPVMNTYIGELAPRQLVGTATGLVNTIWQIGSLLSPIAVGAVLDVTQNYFYAFSTLAIGPALGAIIILAVREKDPKSDLF